MVFGLWFAELGSQPHHQRAKSKSIRPPIVDRFLLFFIYKRSPNRLPSCQKVGAESFTVTLDSVLHFHLVHFLHALHLVWFRDLVFWVKAEISQQFIVSGEGCQCAWRIFVPTRVIVAGQVFTNLHNGEHPTHIDIVMFAWRAQHRNTVARAWHSHFAHVGHPVLAHCHVTGEKRAYSSSEIAWTYSDEIRCVMPHLIHGVMGHMAMHRPIAGIVGNKFDRSRLTDRDQDRVPWLLH